MILPGTKRLRSTSVSDLTGSCIPKSALRRLAPKALAGLAGLVALLGPSHTQNAVANGDTRTISMYHAHTQESITVTFRQQGSYDRAALEKLNRFLRDWRNDEQVNMDPRLFDVVWATWREVGSTAPIRVVSSYRSPVTNNMLRRRSSAVAKNSQHMAGKAMDLHMPDVSMAKVREIGMRLQNGGVGYYPTAGTPFVHLDVGSVRSWPRMPRPQLERLFPDGKTVHLPADGTPLAGYEAALAEIQSRGGSGFSYAEITSPRRSLWAALFGGEDEEVEVAPRRGRNGRQVATRGTPRQVAYAVPAGGGDSSSVYTLNSAPQPTEPVTVAAAPAPRLSPAPKPQPVEESEAPKDTKITAVAALAEPKIDEKRPALWPKLVDLPLPPRRPAGLSATALAAANVPLPPIRPTMMASTEPPSAAAFAPTPAMTASIDKGVLPSAITSGGELPAAKNYKPATVPLPPIRPGNPQRAAIAPATAPAAAPDYKVKLDSTGMAALVQSAATDPKRPAKVELPNMRQAAGGGIVAGKFGADAPAAGAGKFAGSLSRPLEAGFVRRGE